MKSNLGFVLITVLAESSIFIDNFQFVKKVSDAARERKRGRKRKERYKESEILCVGGEGRVRKRERVGKRKKERINKKEIEIENEGEIY